MFSPNWHFQDCIVKAILCSSAVPKPREKLFSEEKNYYTLPFLESSAVEYIFLRA